MGHNFCDSVSREGRLRGGNSPTFRARPQRRKVYVPERKDVAGRTPYEKKVTVSCQKNTENLNGNDSHLYTTRMEFQIAGNYIYIYDLMKGSLLTAPRTLVNVKRSNWSFKVARVGETVCAQWAKFGQDVVRAKYFLDILGCLRFISIINTQRVTYSREKAHPER